MKKIIILGLALFILLYPSPSSVSAVSGCCSSHGGVSCVAGPQSNGKVICNDGWLGSSCYYSEMVMCAGYSTQSTPTPTSTPINYDTQIQEIEAEIKGLQTTAPTPTPIPATPKPTPRPTSKPTIAPTITPTDIPTTTPTAPLVEGASTSSGGSALGGLGIVAVFLGGSYLGLKWLAKVTAPKEPPIA